MPYPTPNEPCTIIHEIHWHKDQPSCVKGKELHSRVTAVYSYDRVRVTSGDVWNVHRVNGTLRTSGRV